MKQSIVIGQLAKMTPDRVLLYDATGSFKTTAVMISAGICACSECGHLQPLEKKECAGCGVEIFVLRAANQYPAQIRPEPKEKPLKREKGTKTIKKYTYV